MAWIVGDSFDYYGSVGDLAHSVWDSWNSVSASAQFAANRFAPGQSMAFGNNATYLTKNFGSNESTVWVVFAYYRPGALTGTNPEVWHQFLDAGTAQCTLAMMQNGNIVLYRGASGGTVIATYSAAFPQDTWTQFQCQIVFSATAGSLIIRKNGATTNTFSATGLNTISTANAYANSYANGFGVSGTVTWPQVDDLLIFSSSGAAPNTWTGDLRAICLMANGDTTQKNFAPNPVATATQTAACSGGQFGNSSWVANRVYWSGSMTMPRGGTVTQLTMNSLASSITGHMKAALYANDGAGGAPGTLLGVSSEVANPAAGVVTFTFPSPIYLSTGRIYWPAWISDVAWTGNATSPNTGSMAQTYATGFPATAPASFTAETYTAYGVVTISGNSCCVSERLANGDTDYVTSTTVGDEDLYQVDDLPITPYAIIGVVEKAYVKKSDAGTRQGQLRVKSGTTEVAGVDTAVASTYAYLARVDTTDPNTSAAWTQAGVNALQVGQRTTL